MSLSSLDTHADRLFSRFIDYVDRIRGAADPTSIPPDPELFLAGCLSHLADKVMDDGDILAWHILKAAQNDVAEEWACRHETRISYGGTGEFDEAIPCPRRGTVLNLADDTLYCLPHHITAEKKRYDA